MSLDYTEFDKRNEEKKNIHTKAKKIFPIHHREIRYVKLGINIWYEQNGKQYFRRPVLVIKKLGNIYFCIPLTTKGKNNKRYHFIDSVDFKVSSAIILSQARSLDSSRFISMIGKVSPEEFIIIKQKIAHIYGYSL